MKILVTGGAGFLGSNLIYHLNQLGYTDIVIVDRLGKSEKWRNLVGLKYSEYFDIENEDTYNYLYKGLYKYDIIFHLGACSSTRENDASYLMSNNYRNSINLVNYALRTNTRFIYASSAATYGNGEMNDNLLPSQCRPLNAYGLSKNMFDQYLEQHNLLDKVVGLKYFNVFGPNCEHKGEMKSFVTKAFEQLSKDKYIMMYETYRDVPEGKDARDFLYIKDAIDMTLHFAFDKNGKKANGLFNIGSGVATSWKDMAYHTIDALDLGILDRITRVKYYPLPCEIREKYQYYTKADITKLINSGFSYNGYTAKEAIEDYVKCYLKPNKKRGEVK